MTQLTSVIAANDKDSFTFGPSNICSGAREAMPANSHRHQRRPTNVIGASLI